MKPDANHLKLTKYESHRDNSLFRALYVFLLADISQWYSLSQSLLSFHTEADGATDWPPLSPCPRFQLVSGSPSSFVEIRSITCFIWPRSLTRRRCSLLYIVTVQTQEEWTEGGREQEQR